MSRSHQKLDLQWKMKLLIKSLVQYRFSTNFLPRVPTGLVSDLRPEGLPSLFQQDCQNILGYERDKQALADHALRRV